jgi:Flp pilus assembly protein protease CpaA
MKGYRTIIFNAVTLLVMVAGAVLQYVGHLGMTDAQAALVGLAATLMVNIGNMYLRSVTTTPLGQT